VSDFLAKTVHKLDLGEHVTEVELLNLEAGYRRVVDVLSPFGERYALVRQDASLKLEQVESYLRARGL
jgi:hypothetical protein